MISSARETPPSFNLKKIINYTNQRAIFQAGPSLRRAKLAQWGDLIISNSAPSSQRWLP
jgi:hypothetical protein